MFLDWTTKNPGCVAIDIFFYYCYYLQLIKVFSLAVGKDV